MSTTVTAIITQDELSFLQALRQMISNQVAAPTPASTAPAPTAAAAPAAAPESTPKTAPAAPAPAPTAAAPESKDRPFKRPDKKRITKLEKQLEDAIANNAKPDVIEAAKAAILVSERKKLVADLKRLEKLKVTNHPDAKLIDEEIGYVNAEIAEMDAQSKVEPESTIVESPDAKTVPTPPGVPTPPKAKKVTQQVVKTMTELAGGGTYDAFIEAGWSEQAMIDAGYLEVTFEDVEEAEEVGEAEEVTIEAFRAAIGSAFPKAAATNRIEAVNDILAKYGSTIDTIPSNKRSEVLGLLESLLG